MEENFRSEVEAFLQAHPKARVIPEAKPTVAFYTEGLKVVHESSTFFVEDFQEMVLGESPQDTKWLLRRALDLTVAHAVQARPDYPKGRLDRALELRDAVVGADIEFIYVED
jgi:hypothetical protein